MMLVLLFLYYSHAHCVVLCFVGRRWLCGGQPLLHKPSAIPPAAPEVLVSNWRQQQQAAVLGLAPRQQQQQQGAASGGCGAAAAGANARVCGSSSSSSSSTAVCQLAGVKLSPYGITSKLMNNSSSHVETRHTQQQQQQQTGAGGDNDMTEAAAATAAAAARQQAVELPLVCPMLLVRRVSCSSSSSTPGWSLLLPAGWVGPFWQALTSAGRLAGWIAHNPHSI
jgi:hypothetical protein